MERIILLVFIFTSCFQHNVTIESPTGEKSLSLIFRGSVLEIIPIYNDKANSEEPRVVFDLGEIALIQRVLYVCWQNEESQWEILIPGSKIIHNDLNLKDFKILTNYEISEGGLPGTIKRYHSRNCFELGLSESFKYGIFPKGNAKITEVN